MKKIRDLFEDKAQRQREFRIFPWLFSDDLESSKDISNPLFQQENKELTLETERIKRFPFRCDVKQKSF